MRIQYVKGNIFNTDCEAIVNPVNCVGVMGAGLAKQFKINYPNNYAAYREKCFNHSVFPGRVFFFQPRRSKFRYIINFPTKMHWKDKSEIRYINKGLEDLADSCIFYKVKSIAIPKLGCGLGGLDWVDVKELIETHLSVLEKIRIECYV
jgi:O-acetyl-ADP-ribose deacetylase (regulator of RNase III)